MDWARLLRMGVLLLCLGLAACDLDDEGLQGSVTAGFDGSALFPQPLGYAPAAVFVADTTLGPPPLLVSFDASASYDPDGGFITRYYWNFGDGSRASGVLARHLYTQVGSYVATLTVTDDEGQQDFSALLITVTADAAPAGVLREHETRRFQAAGGHETFAEARILPTPALVAGAAAPAGRRDVYLVGLRAGQRLALEGARGLFLYRYGEGEATLIASARGEAPALEVDRTGLYYVAVRAGATDYRLALAEAPR